jgi:hypothetical protein
MLQLNPKETIENTPLRNPPSAVPAGLNRVG